ncbi:MAG TPA: YkgJ family cysteine cluster protein [Spirochaetes bacterium]|nr:YkgJ family cysteine cluster protein [Spirochaetota bacterium]
MKTTESPEKTLRCIRCGTCCLEDMIALAEEEDVRRWKREGRDDILHIIENERAVWAGDRLVSARDGHRLVHCPFLCWEGTLCRCAIYETRPRVCRDYRPGSSRLCPLYKK